jgi:hypothetical protein
MTRGSAGAPAYGAWLRRAGRLIVRNQRLVMFPFALRLVQAVAIIPLVVTTRAVVTFGVYARDAVTPEDRIAAVVTGSAADVRLGLVVLFGATVLATAWLSGAFVVSIREGRVLFWPGRVVFANLVVVYALVMTIEVGLAAIAAHPRTASWYLPVALVAAAPMFYADYAVVLERRSWWSAIARSVQLCTRRPGATLTVFAASLVAGGVESAVFITPVTNDTGVFPPFFLVVLLVDALVQYAGDCGLIGVMLEDRAAQGR